MTNLWAIMLATVVFTSACAVVSTTTTSTTTTTTTSTTATTTSSPTTTSAIPASTAIHILSPAAGATLNDYTVLVRGTLLTPQGTEVGVSVNGVRGVSDAGQFAAIVPLSNTVAVLTATAVDASGNVIAHDAVPVTVQAPTSEPLLSLHASPIVGSAPLTTLFTLASRIDVTIALDADGDGIPDVTGSAVRSEPYTYRQPGLYFPTVTALDTSSNTHRETLVVRVFDPTELDRLLQSKWLAFKDALRRGDTTAASRYVIKQKRGTYLGMFDALTVPLSQIDQVLTNITFVEQRGLSVEYAMVRQQNGLPYSYAVILMLDDDGIWRIKAL